MINRSTPHSSFRQFVHLHPFFSILFTLSGPAAFLTVGWKYLPMLLASYQLAKELWVELKEIKAPPHKEKSVFLPAIVKEENVMIGQLNYIDRMPVAEIYTNDPHLSSIAQAKLLASYQLDFHTEYFWYLLTVARLIHGPREIDAVTYINREIRRRDLNLTDDTIRLHYILKEIYKSMARYNQKAPFYLRRADEFNMEYLRAILAFCEVEKGLGRRANGCSTSIIAPKQHKKYFIRNLDWFTFGTFAKYQLKIAEPTAYFNMPYEQKPTATFISTIAPRIIPGITGFNDRGLSIAYNEVGGLNNNRENGPNSYSGLVLLNKIAQECDTLKQVENFLRAHPPASPHNLIVMTRDGHGVIQNMPHQMHVFFNIRGDRTNFCVATNHFLDWGNKAIPESACIDCSQERYNKMQSAITKDKLSSVLNVAQSSATKDTVETMIGKFNYRNKKLILY